MLDRVDKELIVQKTIDLLETWDKTLKAFMDNLADIFERQEVHHKTDPFNVEMNNAVSDLVVHLSKQFSHANKIYSGLLMDKLVPIEASEIKRYFKNTKLDPNNIMKVI